MVARHSNEQRTRSLCTVLSHMHQKQLECGGNESAGVLNSTVPVVPLWSVYQREVPSLAPTAMGSLVQIPCLERQFYSVDQVRKWSNFSQKTGNKDVSSVPTTVTLTTRCLKANCMLDTSVTI